MLDPDFEAKLWADLPRGLEAAPKSAGGDRAVFNRWLTPDEMTGKAWRHEGGLLLGRREDRLIGSNDDRHVLTIAGSRAGKGVSLIIPNLLFYEGSALVIDPKGENARATAGRRGKGTKKGGPGLGQDVHVLDPFGTTANAGIQSACFNPLAVIDLDKSRFVEDAGVFADALVIHPDKDRHWTESAQELLRALILVACADPDPKRKNLVTVRQLVTLADNRIDDKLYSRPRTYDEAAGRDVGKMTAADALIEILKHQDGRHRDICFGAGAHLESMGPEERGSVLSTAMTQTQWLDGDWAQVLTSSDFNMRDLKRKKTTIYLCLPAMQMGTHARWLRLMILLALIVMERTEGKPTVPVLFVLDEFPVLGHIEAIETAAGLMAGFGVKLWTILQNIGQLKRHYKDTWETFVANSGVLTAFSVVDHESLKMLSERLGHMRMVEQVSSGAVGGASLSGQAAFRDDRQNVRLLAEHEINWTFGRDENRLLVVAAGKPPAVAERFKYYDEKDDLFRGLYDEDSDGDPA